MDDELYVAEATSHPHEHYIVQASYPQGGLDLNHRSPWQGVYIGESPSEGGSMVRIVGFAAKSALRYL